jgi:hypothetical protein
MLNTSFRYSGTASPTSPENTTAPRPYLPPLLAQSETIFNPWIPYSPTATVQHYLPAPEERNFSVWYTAAEGICGYITTLVDNAQTTLLRAYQNVFDHVHDLMERIHAIHAFTQGHPTGMA